LAQSENVTEDELYRQLDKIDGLHAKYIEDVKIGYYFQAQADTNNIIPDTWISAFGYSAPRDALAKLPPRLTAELGPKSAKQFAELGRYVRAAGDASERMTARVELTYRIMKRTGQVADTISLVGGPAVIVAKGFQIGGREGLKYVLKRAATYSVELAGSYAAVTGVTALARKAGASEDQIRIGMAVYSALMLRRAMQLAGKCFVGGTQVALPVTRGEYPSMDAGTYEYRSHSALGTTEFLITAGGLVALAEIRRFRRKRGMPESQAIYARDCVFAGFAGDPEALALDRRERQTLGRSPIGGISRC
jgi:hypothetical protein